MLHELLPPIPPCEAPRSLPAWDWSHGNLRVSADGRGLEHDDGTGFLWLGDTAWELLHRLTRPEIAAYLDLRAAQGFTVVQTVCLAELDGVRVPNAEGHLPFADEDPARPVEAYWELLDWVFDQAERRGLALALLPTWGDKVNAHWGAGPRILLDPVRADSYGRWLGARCRSRRNLVWVSGGDRSPTVDGGGGDRGRLDPALVAAWRALALGLRAGDGGRHLITYHTWGQDSSGMYWHGESWLDFNSQQNGHAAHPDLWNRIRTDRDRVPAKPVIDLEPIYEEIPIGFDGRNGWGSAWNVRWFAWIDTLAGAAGHTYGCNGVWQMYAPGRQPACEARLPWRDCMQLPGAWDMGHLRDLLLSRPFPSLEPCQELLVGPAHHGAERIQAARSADGSWAVVYSAGGKGITIDPATLAGDRFRAWWFCPRSGAPTCIGEVARQASLGFTPPSEGQDQDWVLVIDDVARGFPAPGRPAAGRTQGP